MCLFVCAVTIRYVQPDSLSLSFGGLRPSYGQDKSWSRVPKMIYEFACIRVRKSRYYERSYSRPRSGELFRRSFIRYQDTYK
jgi:hypothetical protein